MDLFVEPGTLLLSMPQLMDENFMHTVVLMCEHSPNGAYGLTVNRPAHLTIDQLMPEHHVLREMKFPVYTGGPVGHDTLQFVHRRPDMIPGGMHLSEELYMGGDVEALAEYIAVDPRAVEHVRAFIGYSGWGEGQLDAELATGSWVLAPPSETVVFRTDATETVWRETLRTLGSGGEDLSHQPPDVSWN